MTEQLSDSALVVERFAKNRPLQPFRSAPLPQGESFVRTCQTSSDLASMNSNQTKNVLQESSKKEATRQSAATWTIGNELLNEIRDSVRANGGKDALKRLASRYPGIDKNTFLLDFVYKYEHDCASSHHQPADALTTEWCTEEL
eukprot:TRINITY_DN79412_c0_g1_i1.p2 TRINITY_DN79412_c0_g1~~TRINITY_DN79412_c0_g1_i1.p2  ORF type:complete len:144 (+),score=35.16 TRINITY_DN79412_c0_g1_i1:381-812(+)